MPITWPHFQSGGSTGHLGSGSKIGTPVNAGTGPGGLDCVIAAAPATETITAVAALICQRKSLRIMSGSPA